MTSAANCLVEARKAMVGYRKDFASVLDNIPTRVTYLHTLSPEQIDKALKSLYQEIQVPLMRLVGSSLSGRGVFLIGLDTERQSIGALRRLGIEPKEWWTGAGLTSRAPENQQLVVQIQLAALLVDTDGRLVYRVLVFSPLEYWKQFPGMTGKLPPVLVSRLKKKWTCAGHNVGQDLTSIKESFGLDTMNVNKIKTHDTWTSVSTAGFDGALMPAWIWLLTGECEKRPPSDAHPWVTLLSGSKKVDDQPLATVLEMHPIDQQAAVEKMVRDARTSHAIAAVFVSLPLISMMSLTPEPDATSPGGEPVGKRSPPPEPVRPRPLKPVDREGRGGRRFRGRSCSTGDLTLCHSHPYVALPMKSPGKVASSSIRPPGDSSSMATTARAGPGWFTGGHGSVEDVSPLPVFSPDRPPPGGLSSAFTPHDSSLVSDHRSFDGASSPWSSVPPYNDPSSGLLRSLSSTSPGGTPIEAGC